MNAILSVEAKRLGFTEETANSSVTLFSKNGYVVAKVKAMPFYGERPDKTNNGSITYYKSKFCNPELKRSQKLHQDTLDLLFNHATPSYVIEIGKNYVIATERTPKTETALINKETLNLDAPKSPDDREAIYGILWNHPETKLLNPNGSEVPSPNFLARIRPREFGAQISRLEFAYALRSIDMDTVPESSKGFVYNFRDSLIKTLERYDLSVRQEEVARKVISDFAPEEISKKLGLFQPKVETFDTFVIGVCQKIKPYLASDAKWFEGFAASIKSSRKLTPGQLNIALKFISNYRDQLNATDLETVFSHLPEREEFYKKYTIAYIKLMLAALKYGKLSGTVLIDDKCQQFITFNGVGNENIRHTAWKKLVEFVGDKIEKQVKKGKLEDFAEYISNPDLYHSMINKELKGDSTLSKRVDEITSKISEYKQIEYSDEQKQVASKCLRYLDSVCDGAFEEDGQGFNKSHTKHGKYLARMDWKDLSNEDMNTAVFLVHFYRGQLNKGDVDLVTQPQTAVKQTTRKREIDENTAEMMVFRSHITLLQSCLIL